MTVRVRFAPSPTGYLHIGGARTALFNWMYARKMGGKFILRIEDTDRSRYVDGSIEYIMESLRWLGLEWDEGPDIGGEFGPYIQSERQALYQEWAEWLVEKGHAYKSFMTKEETDALREEQRENGAPIVGYDRRERNLSEAEVIAREAAGIPFTIRFKPNLDGQTVVTDAIRGEIVFENTQINDQVLFKADGMPTYHLANVVDDHFMGITHIIRGDEWINTAPLHVQLYKAFGWDMPKIAHMPVILSPSGKGKLSKRDQAFQDGESLVLVKTMDYPAAGYLSEAVVNFLANVGWAYGDDVEKFAIEDALPRFDLSEVNPAPTQLPFSKLEWLNGQYIQDMNPEALAEAVTPHLEAAGFDVLSANILPVMAPMSMRMKQFPDAVDFLRFLFEEAGDALTVESLTHKKLPQETALGAFKMTREFVATNLFELDVLREGIRDIGEAFVLNGKAGPFMGKARFAVTRQQVSPSLFESMLALGREKTLVRLDAAIAVLSM